MKEAVGDDMLDAIEIAIETNTDLYSCIGAPTFSSSSDLRAAYKTTAMRLHPDRLSAESEETRAEGEEAFKRANNAFEILSNEAARSLYDEMTGLRPTMHMFANRALPNPVDEHAFVVMNTEAAGVAYIPLASVMRGCAVEHAGQKIVISPGVLERERVFVETPHGAAYIEIRSLPDSRFERGGCTIGTTPADLVIRAKKADRGIAESIDGLRGVWVSTPTDTRVELANLGLPDRDRPDRRGRLVIVFA